METRTESSSRDNSIKGRLLVLTDPAERPDRNVTIDGSVRRPRRNDRNLPAEKKLPTNYEPDSTYFNGGCVTGGGNASV
jgi:hypothetical protein